MLDVAVLKMNVEIEELRVGVNKEQRGSKREEHYELRDIAKKLKRLQTFI